jgi:hypothetical protein
LKAAKTAGKEYSDEDKVNKITNIKNNKVF